MVDSFARVNTVPYGAKMAKQKLSKQDWLAAGFRALAADGPGALRAEALARGLQTTKGSFYWHFADLPAYKSAMLTLWQDKAATAIIEEVLKEPDPRTRLELLIKQAATDPPDAFGGGAIEPAIRAWALTDSAVMARLREVDQARIAFVEQLLRDVGQPDPVLARLFYAAYLGTDDLAAKHGMDAEPLLARLIAAIVP